MNMFNQTTLKSLIKLSNTKNPLEGLNYYKENYQSLKNWRYLYTVEDDRGPFKLIPQLKFDNGGYSSFLDGKSLWIIDANFSDNSHVEYFIGNCTYFDSNAASYIRSLAYSDYYSHKLISRLRVIDTVQLDYKHINPYIYLWEVQKNYKKNPRSILQSKQTFAAIYGLQLINKPLNEKWGEIYRKSYKEEAEEYAERHINEFLLQLEGGLENQITYMVNTIEAVILQTKILELSSRKPAEHKLEYLVRFMHDELSTLLLRELVVCADILFHEKKSTITEKLNSLDNRKHPLEAISNCAWDFFSVRALELLTNAKTEPEIDFYIADFLTFDNDILSIFKLAALKGIAINQDSHECIPFLKNDPLVWLATKVGGNRLSDLCSILDFKAREDRFDRRDHVDVEGVVKNKREELKFLIDKS